MTLRILHVADLHLDSPLTGVSLPDSLPRALLHKAPRLAFEKVVALAIDRKAHLVLIAGDVFDDSGNDAQTVLWLRDQLRILDRCGIAVAMLHGNHDHAALGANFVKWPDNVYVFPKEAPTTKTYEWDGKSVCVHGQSFPSRHTKENLTHNFPAAVTGAVNIGLLHTSLTGAVGHDPYAPCTLAELESKGYDYWALGHVHRRQEWKQKRGGWIAFSGNLQGRDMGEQGEKGALWLEIGAKDWEPKFVSCDVLRFREVGLDLTDCQSAEDLEDLLQSHAAFGEPASVPELVRLRFTGATKLHAWLGQKESERNEVAASVLTQLGRHLESIKVRTTSERSECEIRTTDDLRSAVLAAIEELQGDRQTVEAIWSEAHKEIAHHLGSWLLPELKNEALSEEIWNEVRNEILATLEEVH